MLCYKCKETGHSLSRCSCESLEYRDSYASSSCNEDRHTLVAIENDDYHALPGRFYARAFIKEYAQAVGLDPNELLQEFDEGKIQTEEEQTV